MRAALAWGISDYDQRREASLQLAGSLHWYWVIHGFFAEPRRILADLLRDSEISSEAGRASALITAGYLACWQGDFSQASPILEQALRLYRRLEDSHGIALAMHGLGWTAFGSGQYDQAQERFQTSLSMARELDDHWLVSFAVHFLGIVKAFQGDYLRPSARAGNNPAGAAAGLFLYPQTIQDFVVWCNHVLKRSDTRPYPSYTTYFRYSFLVVVLSPNPMKPSESFCGPIASLWLWCTNWSASSGVMVVPDHTSSL